jgi:predicted transcriptional regulator
MPRKKEDPGLFHGVTEDDVITAIERGKSLTRVASELGITRQSLSEWLESDACRSARARSARENAAEAYDEDATRLIEGAADPFELSKAKEMAHHLRWRASKIAPKRYGEKLAIGGADDLPPMKTMSDEALDARIKALMDEARGG